MVDSQTTALRLSEGMCSSCVFVKMVGCTSVVEQRIETADGINDLNVLRQPINGIMDSVDV